MPQFTTYVVLSSLVLIGSLSSASEAKFLQNTIYDQVAQEHGLDPILLYSVSLRESGFSPASKRSFQQPWPWAICYEGGSFFAKNKKEAEHKLRELKNSGYTSIDVGLMQINLLWHKDKIAPNTDIFDPLTNLRIGAKILKNALNSCKGDLVTGIGRYHTWTANRRQAGYVVKVLSTYKQISKLNGNRGIR